MPNVVVYLSAGDEKALVEEGHDPKKWVRAAVKRALSERSECEDQRTVPAPRATGSAQRHGTATELPAASSRSESDHFKPDPKPGKK